jgi:hypothetical protein
MRIQEVESAQPIASIAVGPSPAGRTDGARWLTACLAITSFGAGEGARSGSERCTSRWSAAHCGPQTDGNRSSAWDHRGAKRTWWCVAQRGVAWRGWAGWPASPQTSRLSPALCGDSGQPLPRYEPWWHLAPPSPASVAPRILAARLGGTPHPHLARIGVGAVQNRQRDHRIVSTVCGDAGRPAHQRPDTPRCARRRSASIPTPMHDHDRRSPPRRLPQQM